MSKAIGIDLGTTNSCMATLEGNKPVIISNAEGERTTPSVVSFYDNKRIVGSFARRQAIVDPENTVLSIKRKMGTNEKINIGDKKYSPQEISAIILKKMKDDASDYLGEEVKDAVITVPAYFDDSQRKATETAGRIAGLNVLRIINEPTAAALAYGINKQQISRILVYDFGGGTFDISILKLNKDIFEVIGTKGNNSLGGDDIDQLLIDFLLKKFNKEHPNISLKDNKEAMQRLKEEAEKAKIELSTLDSTNINIPFISTDINGPIHFKYKLDRKTFEDLIKDLVMQTIILLKEALNDNNLTPNDIDKILLVGGTTRIPLVKKMIKEIIGKEPDKEINPDECVAAGAAIQSGIICGDMSDLLLLDVTPLSLGIETHGGVFVKLIERNSTIPIRKSRIFSTVTDNQKQVEIHVYQGERELAIHNKLLGKFILTDIPQAPKGVPQIAVTFDIDINGIVNVSAKDLTTGNKQSISITSSTNLSENEIKKAIFDAEKYAQDDFKYTENMNETTKSYKLIEKAKVLIDNNKTYIRDFEKDKITSIILEIKELLNTKNYIELKKKNEVLNKLIDTISQNIILNESKNEEDNTENTEE